MIKLQQIGKGTYGIVYTAQNEDKFYAVKRNLIDRSVSFTGSLRELDILNRVRGHPFVIDLVSISYGSPFANILSPIGERAYKDDNVHFIFEKADYDCHDFIYKYQTSYQLIKLVMAQMLLSVEYLHAKNIIHRDIKPSNFLFFQQNIAMKICDFGLSKFNTNQGPQSPKMVTSWYRAPEIACGWKDYTKVSDIWSLGCVFYEMISKTPFLIDTSEKDFDIYNNILTRLPQIPTNEVLLKMHKEGKANFNKNVLTVWRKSWRQQLNMTESMEQQFNESDGTLEEFINLLQHMIMVDPQDRLTATKCLNHRFFDGLRDYISMHRNEYPVKIPMAPLLFVSSCKERQWAVGIARSLFQHRKHYSWYSHRILFQAIDLFDRYLEWAQFNMEINEIETDNMGRFHSRFDSELRFYICIYLAMKYFITIYAPISFDKMVNPQYTKPECLAIAEYFETKLIKDILNYQIYRDTVYEAADNYGYNLTEREVEKLFLIYTNMKSYSGITAKRLFKLFHFALGASPNL